MDLMAHKKTSLFWMPIRINCELNLDGGLTTNDPHDCPYWIGDSDQSKLQGTPEEETKTEQIKSSINIIRFN